MPSAYVQGESWFSFLSFYTEISPLHDLNRFYSLYAERPILQYPIRFSGAATKSVLRLTLQTFSIN